jgi:hypothetical protein
MTKLYEQLERIINKRENYKNIWPHHDWTLEDYKELFEYMDKGWIIQGEVEEGDNWLVINPEWDSEPLWTPPQKKKFKFIIKS